MNAKAIMKTKKTPHLFILWDESYLWGLLVWRAMEALGLPYTLVKGHEIAHGLLSCKRPAMLIVPGGTARHKATSLGEKGMQAIRDYVAQGGHYIGFCGGAGLGLSGKHGLGLCPWTRARITDRMQHFVSGHLHVSVKKDHFLVPQTITNTDTQQNSDTPTAQKNPNKRHHAPPAPIDLSSLAGPLPIWWPGRFAEQEGGDVEVLARYVTPTMLVNKDFWVADLPLSALPHGTFDEWSTLYNIHLRPTFLEGQPCIVHGKYGQGTYTLSYSHLETPNSPAANEWLVHLIEKLTTPVDNTINGQDKKTEEHGLRAKSHTIPEWDLEALPDAWSYHEYPQTEHYAHEIHSLRDRMVSIMRTGMEHSLLFRRNAWLIGWRTGIAGGNLNNLHAAMVSVASTPPNAAALTFWRTHREKFLHDFHIFHKGVTGYLLAERLAMTLAKSLPHMVSLRILAEQREALFGGHMESGGLYVELLRVLDELLFLQLTGN